MEKKELAAYVVCSLEAIERKVRRPREKEMFGREISMQKRGKMAGEKFAPPFDRCMLG